MRIFPVSLSADGAFGEIVGEVSSAEEAQAKLKQKLADGTFFDLRGQGCVNVARDEHYYQEGVAAVLFHVKLGENRHAVFDIPLPVLQNMVELLSTGHPPEEMSSVKH